MLWINLDSVFSTLTWLQAGLPWNCGSTLQEQEVIIFLTQPDWLCHLLNLLFNGYQETFPQVLSNWDVMLTTHSHPVERLRMSGAILLLPHMY